MSNGFYTAAQAMMMQQRRLNTISNNIANVKTNGYKKEEVIEQTLDCIQGKDTNIYLVTSYANQLAHGVHEEFELNMTSSSSSSASSSSCHDMYVINYKKCNTSFTNHLTIGTMSINDSDHYDTVHNNKSYILVGILKEVDPMNVPLRMIA